MEIYSHCKGRCLAISSQNRRICTHNSPKYKAINYYGSEGKHYAAGNYTSTWFRTTFSTYFPIRGPICLAWRTETVVDTNQLAFHFSMFGRNRSSFSLLPAPFLFQKWKILTPSEKVPMWFKKKKKKKKHQAVAIVSLSSFNNILLTAYFEQPCRCWKYIAFKAGVRSLRGRLRKKQQQKSVVTLVLRGLFFRAIQRLDYF